MSDQEAIRRLIREMSDAVLEDRPDDLIPLFHPDAVLVAPGLVHRLVGRDPTVQTYRDFLAQAVIHDFAPGDPQIDLFDHTAVATCPYTMDYELDGKVWRSRGSDLLVLTRSNDSWVVIWRTLFSEPEEEISRADTR